VAFPSCRSVLISSRVGAIWGHFAASRERNSAFFSVRGRPLELVLWRGHERLAGVELPETVCCPIWLMIHASCWSLRDAVSRRQSLVFGRTKIRPCFLVARNLGLRVVTGRHTGRLSLALKDCLSLTDCLQLAQIRKRPNFMRATTFAGRSSAADSHAERQIQFFALSTSAKVRRTQRDTEKERA